MTDVLDRLAAADPAGHLPESEPHMALFEHLVAAPATAPARWARVRRAPRTLAFAFGALVATAASVALVVVSVGGGSVDLAAKAYAQSTPSGAIVHYVETARYTPSRGNPKMLGSGQSRLERWVYGDRSHTILKSGGETYDQELGSDQVLHNHIEPGGEDQTLRPGDTEYAHIIAASKQDPVSQYRARYDAGELTDAGETTLEGRTARGYTYTKTARFSYGPETTTDTFYVDPASGELLGSREEVTNASGTSELVRTLTEFERLPVTPENLAKLSR
jgi:hypothetical protein